MHARVRKCGRFPCRIRKPVAHSHRCSDESPALVIGIVFPIVHVVVVVVVLWDS